MAKNTAINWCDDTVNPIMGCSGCEILLPASKVCRELDKAIKAVDDTWREGASREWFSHKIEEVYSGIQNPGPGHQNALTQTNLWHVRGDFLKHVRQESGGNSAAVAEAVICRGLACYAWVLHANRAASIVNTGRKINRGYAVNFNQLTRFPGRMGKVAGFQDLRGKEWEVKPWLNGCPRLIFISDMGDALCMKDPDTFDFLENDVIGSINSPEGKRHFWLWLTKNPQNMVKFAERIGGFPDNVCAMTTLTGSDAPNLRRVDVLKKVDARIRALSIEPLRERIPASSLDLENIDWVIVGGESGSKFASAFDIEWALEIKECCEASGTAFFLKQLGRHPIVGGEHLKLQHSHGSNWNEWPESVPRVRDIPDCIRHPLRLDMAS